MAKSKIKEKIKKNIDILEVAWYNVVVPHFGRGMGCKKIQKGVKNMKKLSLLVALMLLVTVGGVYATWNYSTTTNINPGEIFYEGTALVMTDKVETTSMGDIIVDRGTAKISIDDGGEYKPVMVPSESITITYAPNDSCPLDHRVAKDLVVTIGFTSNWTYDGGEIFQYKDASQTTINLAAGDAVEAEKDGLPTFSWSVDTADIVAFLQINNSIVLKTSDAYTAFSTALHNGSISVSVAVA